MIKGLDTVSNVSAIATTLKSQGYDFVIRYYSDSANSKRMTTAESQAIKSDGLKRVVVYQNRHNCYADFTEEKAASNVSDAIGQAKSMGQPSSVIYFAVDYDASESEIDANITTYFRIVQERLSLAGYGVGVYGSSLVCKKLKENLSIGHTWLAMSTGWGYGTTFNDWNIHQTRAVSINNIDFDENEATNIYRLGAW